MMKQRFYVNGALEKTTKPNAPETLRKWLDNIERDWRRHEGSPIVGPGEFDPNNAHSVARVSLDELVIVTTGNKTLRFINVAAK